MTAAAPAESVPNLGGVGGELFNLVDAAPAYDFNPALQTPQFSKCHESDGAGQIVGERGGAASFTFDQDSCEDGDAATLSTQDPSSNTDFRSTQMSSIVFDDIAHATTITGDGLDRGVPVTFVMTAIDNGLLPGVFSLALSDGYAVSGPLTSGSVQLQ
jgi:hypothetical protein